jgi:hypothetical protein
MIYLLVMASLQAISQVMSSTGNAQEADQRAAQVGQERSLERLSVQMSQGGNVSVTNDGLIPSQVAFLLERGSSGSRELAVGESLAVGGTLVLGGVGGGGGSGVAVVTGLGNVFQSSQSSGPPSQGSKVLDGGIGGPGVDAQIYQNPSDPGGFFLATGSSVVAYSSATGGPLWSFDAGQGEVTDVMPLSGGGGVYVADGYYGNQFTSNLYQLGSTGGVQATYSMRLYRLWTTVEVQYPNGGLPPWPAGSQPVEKGMDSLYAYYDGWFFSASGPSSVTVQGDSYELGASDASRFYLMQVLANPGTGCTNPRGNIVELYAYSADARGVTDDWSSLVFLNTCNLYPNELIASAAGPGTVALLVSQNYFSDLNYFGGPYAGANPFLIVVSASTGQVLRSSAMDGSGYTSVATDGAHVFMSLPATDQVEVVSAAGGGAGTLYDVGVAASSLDWEDNSLFVISSNEVKVYSASMALEKTIDFSPDSLYSLSNSKSMEPQMISPSFLVLNSTSYVALLRNSTGLGSLVEGGY